jgi:uncharacterized protein (TIGR03067 family)
MKLQSVFVSGVVLLFALSATLHAADAKDEAIKKDRKKYEGTWQVISLEVDGNPAGEEDAKKMTVVNEADGKWAIEIDGKVMVRGTSEIDPTKKPRTVDLTVTEGNGKGETSLGIYQFDEEDTRKVCLAPAGKKRPTEFSSTSGSEHILVVLKRVKK